MIYGINDKPPLKENLLFSLQMLLSIFVATALIANICGVNMSAALIGAGLSTLVYQVITKFQSPMFLSNSGAFVSPVLIALSLGGYTGVAIGGLVTAIVYGLFGWLFTKISLSKVYEIFPKAIIGAVTAVIGIGLMGFIPTYVQVNGETNQWGIIVAVITALATALIAHYAKGKAKLLPFLLGTLVGYGVSVILTITGICNLIDFSVFNGIGLFYKPEFAFTKFTPISMTAVITIVITYIAYTISAFMENISDHYTLSNIIGVDLFENPSLSRLFVGTGVANIVGSGVGGLGICTYGEGIAAIGASKVSSVIVTSGAAIMLIILGLLAPVQAFIASVPACVFGGCACILYGFIAASGIKVLQEVDLNKQKNLMMVSMILSFGLGGLVIGGTTLSFSGTALALIIGVILNLILKEGIVE